MKIEPLIERFSIKSYDADYLKKVKLSSLFRYMQDIAWNHAERLSIGYEKLKTSGLFWILSRIRLEIDSYPNWGDEITIETWPKGFNKLFALRDFLLKTQDGKLFARATSAWLIINSETQSIERPDKLPVMLSSFPEQVAINKITDKITPIRNRIGESRIRALYNDIDVNLHVNNSRYIEMIENTLPIDFTEKHQVKSMQVNFLNETRSQEELLIFSEKADNNLIRIEADNAENQKKIFQAEIGYGLK